MAVQIVYLDLVGSETRHDAGSGWIAEGELVVGTIEPNSGGGETIDVGSFCDQVTVTTQRSGQVVDRDEENVGLIVGSRGRKSAEAGEYGGEAKSEGRSKKMGGQHVGCENANCRNVCPALSRPGSWRRS